MRPAQAKNFLKKSCEDHRAKARARGPRLIGAARIFRFAAG
ncbi:50S ribosomal protein L32 [Parvularcula bermudensis HTCC2503]|uniref:50S ribosomal protein L32 n=1 Tax=Parvularcula bermudensis (strain ATCC BAA-594 / HTCC2503 / KCTC 12087) TaxID=314260 RepID=E0TEH7_PARBH|nr:50S ribosomal protein L32 [Parvularcula bermudensis HTCC2503]